MDEKRKTNFFPLFEWVMIVIFGIVVVAIVSVAVYGSVIRSDFNAKIRSEERYRDMWERINDPDEIDYIMIQNSPGDRVVYNVPAELFDDLTCDSFAPIDDGTADRIFREKCVVVVYTDESFTIFNIDEKNNVYWSHSLKVTCPSLIAFVAN